MENEGRIVELLAESLIKQDHFIEELRNVKHEISEMKKEIIKLNLQTAENSRAIIKLANEFDKVIDLHERVNRLENAVYK